LFYHLGKTSLVSWDEAWLASVSQDIAVRGDWLGGQWNGQTWFYEPPLVTWSLAALYKFFGPSEFCLRSFNAFLGLLIIILVFKLSALITKSASSALISVIILLSDIEFLFRSRQINVEIPVTFFLFFTLYSALKTISSRQQNMSFAFDQQAKLANLRVRLLWIITGISLGLAFLTKRASPILILPAIITAVIPPKPGQSKKNIILMIISFLATAVPWYLISYLRWGDQFVNEFFFSYTLGKIRSVNPGAGTDIWFYIAALRHAFKFWFPLIPVTIIWATVKSFRDRKIAVLTIFILSFLIFLSTAPIKSSWFLLPIHPPIAIIIGLFVKNSLERSDLGVRQGQTLTKYLMIGAFSLSAFQLIRYRRDFIVPDTTGRQAAMAKLAGQLTPPQNPIYLDDDYLPVAVFYGRRRVIPLRFNRLQPITPLPIPPGSYILTNTETLPTLQNNYPNISFIKQSAGLILAQNRQP
jgi:4-amino-4-deoxy-L-arabinose transferase-like glycosyltransferase